MWLSNLILNFQEKNMGIPVWAWYAFGACFVLIIIFLLLDYLVIRRNALGATCCVPSSRKRNQSNVNEIKEHHHKRSTNMVLSVQCLDFFRLIIIMHKMAFCRKKVILLTYIVLTSFFTYLPKKHFFWFSRVFLFFQIFVVNYLSLIN